MSARQGNGLMHVHCAVKDSLHSVYSVSDLGKNNEKRHQLLSIPLFHLPFFKHKELIHQMLHIYPVLRLPDTPTTFCFCFPCYSQQTYIL